MIIDPKEIRPIIFGAIRFRSLVLLTFLAASALALVASINWPRMYTSEVKIFVEQKNILGRLMEGAAFQTGVQDQARLAGEILFSRKIMSRVLEQQGFMETGPSALEIEDRINEVSGRTSVSISSPNLISIEYSDTDAEAAFLTTTEMSESFIAESAQSKLAESNSAFEFIDIQVKEYEEKLRASEEKLKVFRSGNESITPGSEGQIRGRIAQIRSEISNVEQNLREARIRESSLRDQLSGEDKSAEIIAVSNSYQTRITMLKEDLDNLRLTYREEYPDILRIKEQIADLEAQAKREQLLNPDAGSGLAVSDASGSTSAILQQNYYEAKILIATLESRLEDTRDSLSEEQQRMQEIPAVELQLKEINREYDVNQAIYSDLLRRREIARVSMNVDREQQGLTLSIHEAPNFPLSPGGPKTYQIIAAGLLFGLFMPIGTIGLVQRLDGKIRDAGQISAKFDVPIISTVPQMLPASAIKKQKYSLLGYGFLMMLIAISVVTVTGLWRLGYIAL